MHYRAIFIHGIPDKDLPARRSSHFNASSIVHTTSSFPPLSAADLQVTQGQRSLLPLYYPAKNTGSLR
jgi:hypothetical protein